MLDYLNSEDGSSAAEYSVILAVLGMGLAAALFAMGPAISNHFTSAAAVISAPNGQAAASS
jgi:Flp pilus assembly pilin Flp